MKTAVMQTGGKQYVVQEGDRLKVEKLDTAVGGTTAFSDVLMIATEKTVTIGTPRVAGATVEAKVVQHGRAEKVAGVKMKAKKRYRHYFGHRQSFTEVAVTAIRTKRTGNKENK